MADDALTDTRGILRVRRGLESFQMSRRPPCPELEPYVSYHWTVSWDLRGRPPHRQQVLPHPSVHMTFMSGRDRITGVVTGVFAETIEGLNRVVGVRFRPGGFRPFLDGPVSALTDREVPVAEVFGADARMLAGDVVREPEVPAAVELIENFLRKRTPTLPDPAIDEVAGIVDRIAADPAIVRVDSLAAGLGCGTRRLQRLFAEYVGAGPKFVIRRYRMHEAAERAAAGAAQDWAALAADLGYADQAHFIRDFTAMVGTSPAQYARECAP